MTQAPCVAPHCGSGIAARRPLRLKGRALYQPETVDTLPAPPERGDAPDAASPFRYEPPPGLPTVLHADAHLLAVDKPSGLLSVPGRGDHHHDSAWSRLQACFGPLWVVHRLDMDTSGVIVYARTREAAAGLGRCFERRQPLKQYLAWVQGHPEPDSGEIDLPLRLDWPHRPRQVVDPVDGKPSQTRYRVLTRQPLRSRLLLEPRTGRSHQLRVHLSAIGHPIEGDRFYGPPEVTHAAGGTGRLMLHAWRLSLPHPVHDRVCDFEAPSPF